MGKENFLKEDKHLYYKYSHSELYNDLFKEFKINDTKKLNNYINNFKYNENSQSWFKNKSLYGLKKYTCFLRLENNEEVLEYEVCFLKSNSSIINLSKKILDKFEHIKHKNRSNILIKISIIEHSKKNNFLIKKLKYEYCKLNDLLTKEDSTVLAKLNNFLFKHNISIFLGTTFLLTLFVLERLNDMGIPIDSISIETLTLVSNITIMHMMILLLVSAILIVVYFSLLSRKVGNCNCTNYSSMIPVYTKSTANLFIFLYPIFVLSDYYFTEKDSIIKSKIAETYIYKARHPSIRKISFEQNSTENILLMGKDSKFIYYLPENNIKRILKETNSSICISLDENSSYIHSIIDLLNLYQDNYSKSVSNKRFHMKKIKDISFTNTLPSFQEAFCSDKNVSDINSTYIAP